MDREQKAPTNFIRGKHVKEYVDLPFGKFAEMVRKELDPDFGLDLSEGSPPRKFQVTISYRFSGYGTKTLTVEAPSVESAKKAAETEFQDCELDFDNADVSNWDIDGIEDVTND